MLTGKQGTEAMYKILLTHGRQQEMADGPMLECDAANLADAVNEALQLTLMEQSRRGDGLPDGYKVLDDQDQQVRAEWIGLRHA
jgi:hypothetical protein